MVMVVVVVVVLVAVVLLAVVISIVVLNVNTKISRSSELASSGKVLCLIRTPTQDDLDSPNSLIKKVYIQACNESKSSYIKSS